MLHEVGGRVLWSRPLLTAPYYRDLEKKVTRSRLLLVPTVFADGLRLFVDHDERLAMAYQARAAKHFHVLTARRRRRRPTTGWPCCSARDGRRWRASWWCRGRPPPWP